MSSDEKGPPAHLMDEIPLPDEEWGPGSSGPVDDVPPPDEAWMPSEEPPPPADFGPPGDMPPVRSGPPVGKRPTAAGSAGTGSTSDGQLGRGSEVKIIGGTEGVGVVGEVFWWGESKFGAGMRAGVRGPDDRTYWVDEEHLGQPGDDVPEAVVEAAADQPDMGKGDRVRVTKGRDSGTEGVIFWWGDSKYGDGMRAGLETDDGQTVWADAGDLERVD